MTIGTWLILVGLCLLYVALGLWAVSHIFPGDRATKLKTVQINNRRARP